MVRHPVRAAAQSDAALTRDRWRLTEEGPGSAMQHCMLHCIRDDGIGTRIEYV